MTLTLFWAWLLLWSESGSSSLLNCLYAWTLVMIWRRGSPGAYVPATEQWISYGTVSTRMSPGLKAISLQVKSLIDLLPELILLPTFGGSRVASASTWTSHSGGLLLPVNTALTVTSMSAGTGPLVTVTVTFRWVGTETCTRS